MILPASPSSAHRSRAFTLVEVMVSMAILSIVIVGMTSAIVLATRSVPAAESGTNRTIDTADLVGQISAELRYAITITERSTSSIAFTVADRTGDSFPETIRYSWSGTAGDPLVRTVNGVSAVTVLADVETFDLSYHVSTIEEDLPGGGESPEQLLAYFSSIAWSDLTVTATDWPGMYFQPTLPASATGWRVTKVSFWAKSNWPPDGEIAVQVQSADGSDLPSGTVLTSTNVAADGLNWMFHEYEEVGLAGMSRLLPTEGACLVIRQLSGSQPAGVLVDMSGWGSGSANQSFLMTLDGGQSWSSSAGSGLEYAVYGAYTADDIPQTLITEFVDRADLTIQIGDDPSSAVHTSVHLFNAPEVMAP